ncbi:MAG: hypothetical protein UV79_C0004G0005 [candidate division TM6 bacterium GW2011_GWF2_43_17]|nr:MAG: hypothetical protein UV79_C0004G0005 [candidate division TM6 bacterium GW2011_GWF2_43_17]HAU30584.1 hypothetical protein [Candidatus Dependentiae bacterium]
MVVRDVFASYVKNSETRFWIWIVFLAFLFVGSWYAYRAHQRGYEQKAQLALVQGIEALARAQSSDSVEHMWQSAEQVLSEGYRRYSRSSLAPYFLLFQADAVAGQGDLERSRALAEDAAKYISQGAPLYEPLKIRAALQDIDSSDEKISARGRESLHAIAQDTKNIYQAMAVYFEGLLAFDSGDRASAEEIWALLMRGAKKGSVWGELASAKLSYQL